MYKVNHRLRVPQEIETVSPVWEWSEELEAPVITGEHNDAEEIQSYEDCALDRILDKFLPEEAAEMFGVRRYNVQWTDEEPNNQEDYNMDLDKLNEISAYAEDMRERYGLPADMSYARIFAEVEKKVKANGNSGADSAVSGADRDPAGNNSNVDSDGSKPATENNETGGKAE